MASSIPAFYTPFSALGLHLMCLSAWLLTCEKVGSSAHARVALAGAHLPRQPTVWVSLHTAALWDRLPVPTLFLLL